MEIQRTASQATENISASELAEMDARLERKYRDSSPMSFVEELGSQEWHFATKLSE